MVDVIDECRKCGLVPVVVLEDAADAVPLARAMLAGGINVMEITFRTDAAEESIRAVTAEVPGMLVGAGTVRNLDECRRALAAGANFVVSPALDVEVVAHCLDADVPVLPGTATPTDINTARNLGLRLVKFFPAGAYGGLKALKALHGPFPDMLFLPTGGVNSGNAGDYLRTPYVVAVGGSWVCPEADIMAHRFEKITELCAAARESIDAARA
ncbi:bifunctional 4-hydroxy-2-oxoglutarate aldolase/2-dehydro-3-deoxy-phosphogluconate aldolase [Actinobaculum sp. 313]|uniref:bifunctional 4-hydroxy-2-oxoglutarate aldolase/2-dehydro-3-deoxy-phosphogluconate aldolase n=1 Tax=Actinobaculum sp. 313 TaxID=2495645 RepID=UPI000D5298FD|nr:bifunctional 4-hydroxy-2-oxoglutarate aldolase/2-dehydro-3-deoxy-phosphogluconate aldolase [Actinobaculum sp. 313]AWE43256.1 2-dehydro-3-deoxyphosphogluconate aldolase [Actinobaculum sp. 313]